MTTDRELGDDYDTVEDVIEALVKGIDADEYLISLTPNTREKLLSLAANPLAEV